MADVHCPRLIHFHSVSTVHFYGSFVIHSSTEHIINKDPLVRSSMIFGNGRPQNGILVDPFNTVSEDTSAVEEYINKIWCVRDAHV